MRCMKCGNVDTVLIINCVAGTVFCVPCREKDDDGKEKINKEGQ